MRRHNAEFSPAEFLSLKSSAGEAVLALTAQGAANLLFDRYKYL
jgi:hypothetical protein